MKQGQEFETDRLKKFINPADIEKAPDGFTDNLMMHIRMDAATSARSSACSKRGFVPYISTGITSLLILIAFLSSGTESLSPVFNWLDKLDHINSIMTGIKFKWTFSISLPEIMVYVTISIFMLLIFDRSLSLFFRHET